MNPFRSALALVRSLTTTSATGVFVPPISGNPDPYDSTDFVNTLTAIETNRSSMPGLAYGELPNTNPGGWL